MKKKFERGPCWSICDSSAFPSRNSAKPGTPGAPSIRCADEHRRSASISNTFWFFDWAIIQAKFVARKVFPSFGMPLVTKRVFCEVARCLCKSHAHSFRSSSTAMMRSLLWPRVTILSCRSQRSRRQPTRVPSSSESAKSSRSSGRTWGRPTFSARGTGPRSCCTRTFFKASGILLMCFPCPPLGIVSLFHKLQEIQECGR